MSRLLRMTYGYGGTRLERICVSASHLEPAPPPLWQRLLLLAVWIVVPLLVSLYAVPKSSPPMKTIIDISRLTIKPPPVLEKPVPPKPKPAPPIEKPVEPAPKPETIREPDVKKTLERQTIAPPPVEMKRPSISRSSAANLPGVSEHQPRVARERSRVETGIETVSKERIRRKATTQEAPSERTAITRSRGATAMDSSIAQDRIAVLRRTAPSGNLPSAAGNGIPQRSIQRSQRSAGSVEDGGQRVVATRERSNVSGGGADGESSSTVGLVRGLSLMSLEICSSPQKQEEAIKAVLSVVGSRQSCIDGKGEFQFKGTQRISSFNLMIFPSKGRRPSNRCEELDNAYKCLKTH
jgi:hypothetical protein